MRPMLATRGVSVPAGPGWLHEVKWDGVRVLACVEGGSLRLWSRNENDVTIAYPELEGLGPALGHDAVLDGEIVGMLDGVPRFGALAERMHLRDRQRAQVLAKAKPVTLLVFDVLSVDGNDVTGEPLSIRRELLEALDVNGPHWRTPPTYDDGPALFEATKAQGLEGVVSKRVASCYFPGRRTKDWLKFPNRLRDSYVVGGWRHETDSMTRLGAVLVGSPTRDGLVYRGKVGAGLAGKEGDRLRGILLPLAADANPFSTEVPRPDVVGTLWVRPEVVVEVEALGMTPQLRLRQPAYCGLRTDVTPAELVEEGEPDA